jgi:hypothetical protein
VNSKNAAIVLRKVLPFLIVKKLQAEIGIKYCDTILDRKHCVRGTLLSEEIKEYREDLRSQMFRANNRSNLYE